MLICEAMAPGPIISPYLKYNCHDTITRKLDSLINISKPNNCKNGTTTTTTPTTVTTSISTSISTSMSTS